MLCCGNPTQLRKTCYLPLARIGSGPIPGPKSFPDVLPNPLVSTGTRPNFGAQKAFTEKHMGLSINVSTSLCSGDSG